LPAIYGTARPIPADTAVELRYECPVAPVVDCWLPARRRCGQRSRQWAAAGWCVRKGSALVPEEDEATASLRWRRGELGVAAGR
jgi:hypothetical protein